MAIGGITGALTGLYITIIFILAAIRRRHANIRKHTIWCLAAVWLLAGWYSGLGVRGCYVVSLAVTLVIILVPLLFVFIGRSARTVGSKGPG